MIPAHTSTRGRTSCAGRPTVGIVVVLALVGRPRWSGCRPGAVESGAASDVGVTAKTIKVAVVADVDNPIAPGRAAGHRRRRPGLGQVRQRQRWDRRPQGAGRLHRLEAEPERHPQRHHQGVLGGLRARRHRRVAAARRHDDITSCADSAGKATGIPDIAALVTNAAEGCAPTGYAITPAVGGVRHDRQVAADVPRQQRRLEVPAEEEQGPARFVRARQRLAVGGQDVEGAEQGRRRRRASRPTARGTSPRTRRRASTRRSSRR